MLLISQSQAMFSLGFFNLQNRNLLQNLYKNVNNFITTRYYLNLKSQLYAQCLNS